MERPQHTRIPLTWNGEHIRLQQWIQCWAICAYFPSHGQSNITASFCPPLHLKADLCQQWNETLPRCPIQRKVPHPYSPHNSLLRLSDSGNYCEQAVEIKVVQAQQEGYYGSGYGEICVNGAWWYSETVRNIQEASSRFSTRFTQSAIYSLGIPGIPFEYAHDIEHCPSVYSDYFR